MSALKLVLDPEGEALTCGAAADLKKRELFYEYFPDWDKHKSQASLYRGALTSIYRTKDDRFFHTHGLMNPDPMLKALGLPHDISFETMDEVVAPIQEVVLR